MTRFTWPWFRGDFLQNWLGIRNGSEYSKRKKLDSSTSSSRTAILWIIAQKAIYYESTNYATNNRTNKQKRYLRAELNDETIEEAKRANESRQDSIQERRWSNWAMPSSIGDDDCFSTQWLLSDISAWQPSTTLPQHGHWGQFGKELQFLAELTPVYARIRQGLAMSTLWQGLGRIRPSIRALRAPSRYQLTFYLVFEYPNTAYQKI